MHPPVRDPNTLSTLIQTSSSSAQPLLTLWTASWCSTCRQILPLIQDLIEKEKVGEAHGGVGFVEVEYDAPGNEEGGMRYMINSVPTLLAFSRGEAQVESKVVKKGELADREFLRGWVEREARRGGEGGAGGQGILGALFGRRSV
ncbi:MAG: hypothetical protein MMC23_008161 [Stictis urceolatum]|nr:hypothetical protein [Stictis urceolata]